MKVSKLVKKFVEFKQSIGMRYHYQEDLLRIFSKVVCDKDISKITPREVRHYLDGKGPLTAYWHNKYQTLKIFYGFVISRGFVSSSPLPTTIPKRPQSDPPYIYSSEEICRLLNSTRILQTPKSRLQAETYRTLLLLLYGTGLRISEAISLMLTDVNFQERLISVRNSKFFKSRLVPIGPRLTSHLSAYFKKRRRLAYPDVGNSPFFCVRNGNALAYKAVNEKFQILRREAGIHRGDGSRYQPRIHDLRHTFAVHRLLAWYRQGKDVQRLLVHLSTYLGHTEIAHTQRYLSMTPELLQEANRRFEHYVISEVTP